MIKKCPDFGELVTPPKNGWKGAFSCGFRRSRGGQCYPTGKPSKTIRGALRASWGYFQNHGKRTEKRTPQAVLGAGLCAILAALIYTAGAVSQVHAQADVEVMELGAGEVQIAWDSSERADGYVVYVNDVERLRTAETFANLMPEPGDKVVRVTAYNEHGESPPSNPAYFPGAFDVPERPGGVRVITTTVVVETIGN